MSDKTSIEWTDATWNPIKARRKDTGKVGWHCERVSPACTNCYAAAMNRRNLNVGTGLDYTRTSRDQVDIFLDEKALLAPLKWKRARKVFVCSMTDLFAEFVPFEMIDRVFAVMYNACPLHTFQVLTKRPERMAEYFSAPDRVCKIACAATAEHQDRTGDTDVLDNGTVVDDLSAIWPLPNVWLGTTVENQEWADKRIPWLLKCPAAVRFLSVEPMLGAIDLSAFMGGPYVGLPGDCVHENYNFGIDWTICGGESGRNARPMHPDCVMSLRGQCAAAVVPFFFKQWGEWSPLGTHRDRGIVAFNDGRSCEFTADAMRDEERRSGVAHNRCHPLHMYRVGKKAAGRLLDGVEHSEFPAAPEPAV